MINFFCPKLGKCFDVPFAFFLFDGPPEKKGPDMPNVP